MKIKFIVDKYDDRYNQKGDKTPPLTFIADTKNLPVTEPPVENIGIPIQGENFDIRYYLDEKLGKFTSGEYKAVRVVRNGFGPVRATVYAQLDMNEIDFWEKVNHGPVQL